MNEVKLRPLSLDDITDRQGGSAEALLERPLAIEVERMEQDAPIDFEERRKQTKALRESLRKDEARRMLLSKAAILNRDLSGLHRRLAEMQELGGEGLDLQKAIDQERAMLGEIMTSLTAIK